ncbi:hypothetical protein E6O75_ATG03744 [Venturia nashicola]|uniref:Uncharacterized protein n=1 Tax=Venturia nashicola TaxID=86259 RepID=A0A4Z1PJE2_9PEZI|nr:hypothetical protein E6O75_ATG03744 [Venturia nashicola]
MDDTSSWVLFELSIFVCRLVVNAEVLLSAWCILGVERPNLSFEGSFQVESTLARPQITTYASEGPKSSWSPLTTSPLSLKALYPFPHSRTSNPSRSQKYSRGLNLHLIIL